MRLVLSAEDSTRMGAAVSVYVLVQEPLVIVGHQGILRVIYAFFMDLPRFVRHCDSRGLSPRPSVVLSRFLSAEPFPDC